MFCAEAKSINKSLSALGDVVSALTTGESFIPYRNHKLTELMRDSLGGNAKTLMIVNASPLLVDAGEARNSLEYATRVKQVRTGEFRVLPNCMPNRTVVTFFENKAGICSQAWDAGVQHWLFPFFASTSYCLVTTQQVHKRKGLVWS